jgi:hypothetical protein
MEISGIRQRGVNEEKVQLQVEYINNVVDEQATRKVIGLARISKSKLGAREEQKGSRNGMRGSLEIASLLEGIAGTARESFKQPACAAEG